jgi:hypothetical protein
MVQSKLVVHSAHEISSKGWPATVLWPLKRLETPRVRAAEPPLLPACGGDECSSNKISSKFVFVLALAPALNKNEIGCLIKVGTNPSQPKNYTNNPNLVVCSSPLRDSLKRLNLTTNFNFTLPPRLSLPLPFSVSPQQLPPSLTTGVSWNFFALISHPCLSQRFNFFPCDLPRSNRHADQTLSEGSE